MTVEDPLEPVEPQTLHVQVLALTDGEVRNGQYTSSYLVQRRPAGTTPHSTDPKVHTLAVDAGCLGFLGAPRQQRDIRHILLTHAHLDHIASLPVFLENVYEPGPDAPTVHASRATLDALQAHLFNGVVWPDFIGMSNAENAFVHTRVLEPGQTVGIDGFRVEAVAVDHVVPTQAYVIEAGRPDAPPETPTVVFAADSGPTRDLWASVRSGGRTPVLAFVEASFPSTMRALAELSKHLTPQMLSAEIAGLPGYTQVVVVHVKPRYLPEITAEVAALGAARPGLALAEPGRWLEVAPPTRATGG